MTYSGKWRITRSRDTWMGCYRRGWIVTSPWRLTDNGRWINCDIREFGT